MLEFIPAFKAFFVCDSCNCVDHGRYLPPNQGMLCYQCRTGAWHGAFPKEVYDPEIHVHHRAVVNRAKYAGKEGGSAIDYEIAEQHGHAQQQLFTDRQLFTDQQSFTDDESFG